MPRSMLSLSVDTAGQKSSKGLLSEAKQGVGTLARKRGSSIVDSTAKTAT